MCSSRSIAVVFVLFSTLLIVADEKNGAKAFPVLNHENQLRHKLNQIDREDEDKHRTTVNGLKSLTNFGKHSYGVSDSISSSSRHSSNNNDVHHRNSGGRAKRQFDFDINADHEEGVGTDIVALATANLYKSVSGETRLDGKARYSQHFDDYSGYGKAKVGGSLHFSHNY